MNVHAGDIHLHTTGWLNKDGHTATDPTEALYRTWSVCRGTDLHGFLSLPIDVDPLPIVLLGFGLLDEE